MIEQIVLGIIQGITEWLPVSSKGILILVKTHYFHDKEGLETMIRSILFLHLGTFLAALIYFWNDVKHLFKALFNFPGQPKEVQNLFIFLFLTTAISGSLGLCLLKLLDKIASKSSSTEKFLTILTGCFLLITAYLQFRSKHGGTRQEKDLKTSDGIILGLTQAFAAIPGLSRSGTTIAALVLIGFEKVHAVRLSFLMSLPIVLIGNIVLNFKHFVVTQEALVGVGVAFIVGIATIHVLLKLVERVNFGVLLIIFATLTICSAFL
jgi:undecaprenyl-diphosphatase